MGMAASQARLLTITARLHDVEYKAQSIQNAKIQLATQSDQVYQEYLDALDATTLTVKDVDGQTITANFNNLFSKNHVNYARNNYVLMNSDGKLIVEDDIFEAYSHFESDDPYKFALLMLGSTGNAYDEDKLAADEDRIYRNHENDDSQVAKDLKDLKEKMDQLLNENGVSKKQQEDCAYESYAYLIEADDARNEYLKLEKSFKDKLYSKFAKEIYELNTCSEDDDFNSADFNFYVNTFKQIKAAGGCISIEDRKLNGPVGNAANDSEWLQDQIKSGNFIIDVPSFDKDGNVIFNATAPSSDSLISYTTTTTIDKSALAKAEAEYETKTKKIDKKEKQFDMDLSKLETERTALTTEYESVKKVINDNIERTFGIFS